MWLWVKFKEKQKMQVKICKKW